MDSTDRNEHPPLIRLIVAVASLAVGVMELVGLLIFWTWWLLRSPAGIAILGMVLVWLGIQRLR